MSMRTELLKIVDRQYPHDVAVKPKEIWILPHGDKSIPEYLRHGITAFLEDYIHDWHWSNGKLFIMVLGLRIRWWCWFIMNRK